MKIWKIAQHKENYLHFFHATIPQYAEEIIESGFIRASNLLSSEHDGWYFSPEPNYPYEYSSVVYLSKSEDLAKYYVMMRMRKIWEQEEEIEDLYNEDNRFFAMFDVYIRNTNFELLKKSKSPNEFVYSGEIPKEGDLAFWEGPRWISVELECDEYIKHIMEVNQELMVG